MPRAAAGWIASLVMLAAFACSVGAFILLWDKPEDERVVSDTLYTWLSAGEFRVEMNILFDPLSAVMLLVVTGVGFLIHVYSIGYMRGDPEERRFFAYLNLFVFSMLLLVLAGNFVLLLAGWGLVGLSSYLLIGYWHQRKSAVDAAKKAFVMNAIGDIGLAIGIFLIFRELGTVDYLQVFAGRDVLGDDSTITNWVCVLLLIGALAKSAQVPLHTWLPDAMEGPTPVSALIHAATMVTAGVYLIARMNPLFFYAPSISDAVVVIGVIGLLMAGLIAIVQTDIKRIIAYSTMSQIAYMFVGVGLGAYWAGMFHLVTHAFFKALLFMGAGIVIHVLSDEQDVRRMGGLRAYLPKTYICMWIGTLALVGIFPLSGGFSKDAIIGSGIAGGHVGRLARVRRRRLRRLPDRRLRLPPAVPGLPRPAVGVRGGRGAEAHGSTARGPGTMLWPVYILAVLTAVAGVLQVPGATHYFSDWLEAMPAIPLDGMLEPTLAAGVVGDRGRDDGRRARLDPGLRPLRAAERRARAGADGQRPHPLRALLAQVLLGRALLLHGLRARRGRRALRPPLRRVARVPGAARLPRARLARRRPRPLASSRPAPSAPTRSCSRSASPASSSTSWRRRHDRRLGAHLRADRRRDRDRHPAAVAPRRRVPVGAGGPRRGRRRRRPRLPLRARRRPAVRGRRRVDPRPRHPLPRRRRRPDAGDDGHDRARHRVHGRLRDVGRPRRARASTSRCSWASRARCCCCSARATSSSSTSASRPC